MFYLSHDESVEFCVSRNWRVEIERRYPVLPPAGFDAISFMVPPERERLPSFCRLLSNITPFGLTDELLLWPMHWHDWGSRTNYHLYYRLRQSYGDFKQIHQSPGHLFMGHETEDIITFVELGLLFGWDFQLVSSLADWGAYHDDELLIIYSSATHLLEGATSALEKFGIKWRKHEQE